MLKQLFSREQLFSLQGFKYILFSVAILFSLGQLTLPYILPQKKIIPSTNKIRVSSILPKTSSELILIASQDFNEKTKDEIFALRTEAASLNPLFIEPPYAPSDIVFGRIGSKLSWFSYPGHYVFGRSEISHQGVSVESRNILNPLLLISPEFWGASIWQSTPVMWNEKALIQLSNKTADNSKFPFTPRLVGLRWDATYRRFEARYDAAAFLNASAQYMERPLTVQDLSFRLISYNARDLNLKYVSYIHESSSNIVNDKAESNKRYYNSNFLRDVGLMCGVSSGCNHNIHSIPELSTFSVSKLPAHADFLLTEHRPPKEDPKAIVDESRNISYRIVIY